MDNLSFSFSVARTNESSYYNNTITLLRLWKNRLDQADLENETNKLQNELISKTSELKSKIRISDETNIPPIGID